MYEIWLALNILYELMWNYMPFVLSVVALWVILMTYALLHNAAWRQGLKRGLQSTLVVVVVTFLVFPSITKSSLNNLGYWIDYVFLLQIAVAYGVVFGLGFAWPLWALAARQSKTSRAAL